MLFTAAKILLKKARDVVCGENIIKGLETRGLDGVFIGKGDRWQIYFILILVMKPADHKNAVCSLLDESVMSFSNARMITHVQTSIVIITLLFYTRALNKSFVVVVYFFFLYAIDFILLELTFSLTITGKCFFFKEVRTFTYTVYICNEISV